MNRDLYEEVCSKLPLPLEIQKQIFQFTFRRIWSGEYQLGATEERISTHKYFYHLMKLNTWINRHAELSRVLCSALWIGKANVVLHRAHGFLQWHVWIGGYRNYFLAIIKIYSCPNNRGANIYLINPPTE